MTFLRTAPYWPPAALLLYIALASPDMDGGAFSLYALAMFVLACVAAVVISSVDPDV